MTDTKTTAGASDGFTADERAAMKERARELNPLFILHGGDIGESGSAGELSRFLELVRSVKGLPPMW